MAAISQAPPRGELVSIQYLRGLAASLVVLYHIFGFERYGMPEWQFGSNGVDIFFVISGFIMWATAQRLTPGPFLLRRAVRVVPLYWLFTGVMIALAAVLPGGRSYAERGIGPLALLLDLSFIPHRIAFDPARHIMPILPQGWTLTYEMIFYLLFAVALLLPGRGQRAALVTAALVALAAIGWTVQPQEPIAYALTNPIMLEFLFGIAIAAMMPKLRERTLLWTVVALAGGALILVFGDDWHHHPIAVGIPAAMIVLGVVGLEPLLRRRRIAPLHAAGDASYALYLSHSIVLKGVAIFFSHLPLPAALARAPGVPIFPLFAVTGFVASFAIAFAVHHAIERPLTLWLNDRLGIRRKPASPRVVAA